MISIQLTGEQELQGALNRLETLPLIIAEWMKSGQPDEIMNKSFEQNFTSQGRPKWFTLLPDTIAQRKQQGYSSGPILVRTGNLRDEVTNMRGNVDTFETGAVMSWGIDQIRDSSAGKFATHQMGRDNIPARPMVGFQSIDGTRLVNSLREWILIAMK